MRTTIDNQPTTFANVNEVRSANKAIGHNWFDKGSMNFFNTHINFADKLINKRFFISSEQFVSSMGEAEPRMFTIRVVSPTGEVETYGKFQAYKTKKEAITVAHKIN